MEKEIPQNYDAEKCVLGSVLLNSAQADAAFLLLKPAYFYQRRHRLIFEVMVALFDEQQAVDLILVQDEIIKQKALDQIGGLEYLGELLDSVPTAAHCEFYAKIVRDKYLLRSLISTCADISQKAYNAEEGADAVIDEAEALFFDLTQKRSTSTTYSIKEVLKDSFAKLQSLQNRSLATIGVPSGFRDLDAMTNGFEPSQFIVLAARPSMGKTTLALNMIVRMAMSAGKAPLLFSMEMARDQVTTNMLCSYGRLSSHKVRRGMLNDEEWNRLGQTGSDLSKGRIFIDDSPGLNVMELRAKARRMKLQEDIDIIFIDYLQLINGRGESRQQEISYISRSLKSLARELAVPVISLSQLSRAVESRENHRPRLSDLRESGAIEQDADIVMMLYRAAYYKDNKVEPDQENVTEIILAKQRNGPTGTVNLSFLSQIMRFEDHISESSTP